VPLAVAVALDADKIRGRAEFRILLVQHLAVGEDLHIFEDEVALGNGGAGGCGEVVGDRTDGDDAGEAFGDLVDAEAVHVRMEPEEAGGVAGRDVDVVLDGLVGGGLVGHDHRRQFAGGIAEDVDVVAVGGVGGVGLARLDDETVSMNIDGVVGEHGVHHGVAAVGVFRVGGRRGQVIDELHAEVVAGIELEADAAVGGDGLRSGGAAIALGDGCGTHLEDPGGGLELAEGNLHRLGDDEQVEQVVGTGEDGRAAGGGGASDHGRSATADEEETQQAGEAGEAEK